MRMKTSFTLLSLLLAVLLVMPAAAAQSLWADSSAGAGSAGLFADRKARNVGDILTILISESTTTSASKSNANGKSGNQSLSAGAGIFSFLAAHTTGPQIYPPAPITTSGLNSFIILLDLRILEINFKGNARFCKDKLL